MGENNKFTIQVVTVTLALLALTCVVTVCYMAIRTIQIPPELNTVMGGLVGAVTAMLVKSSPTSSSSSPTQPTGAVTVPEQKLETTTTL